MTMSSNALDNEMMHSTENCEMCKFPLPSKDEWNLEGAKVQSKVCSDECLLLFGISMIRLTQNMSTFELQNKLVAMAQREEDLEGI